MCKQTISTFELLKMFPDEKSARTYLETVVWGDSPACPYCGETKITPLKKEGYLSL